MKRLTIVLLGAAFFLSTLAIPSFAGPPFNNIEGVGGVVFNPLAYTAGTAFEKDVKNEKGLSYKDFFSKPQIGAWYVSLGQADVDWTAISVSETFFKRLEVSYGYENINVDRGENIHMNNVGGKLLLLEENFKGIKYLPAVSFGAIYKHTDVTTNLSQSGCDYYLVATKLITQLPLPVLVSVGGLSTKGIATGVVGFDSDRDTVFFGNIDILPISQLAIGFEYKQGAKFDDVENADYYNVHAAWFVNKNLSLIAAYVNTGATKSSSKVGLGDGVVLSAQYAF
jgi:hypothetical protein